MKKKHIMIILVVMAAVIAVLAWLNRPEDQPVTGKLEITVDGKSVTYTMEEIMAMPKVEFEKEIVSSSQENQKGTFTGVTLDDLLDAADANWQSQATMVVARAEDGYTSAFDVAEVTADDNIVVAYLIDGESLGTKEDGGVGPFRIVVRDDEFGTRSTYWLSQIEVQ